MSIATPTTTRTAKDWKGLQLRALAKITLVVSTPPASGASAQRGVGPARKLDVWAALASAVLERHRFRRSGAMEMPRSATPATLSCSVDQILMDGHWSLDLASIRLLTWKRKEPNVMIFRP